MEKRNIVRNGIAVREHPLRIAQIEMDERCHVVPTTKVETEDVIAEIVEELFHLESLRVRFDQRHALDVAVLPSTQPLDLIKEIVPPQSFLRRFRFGNVER